MNTHFSQLGGWRHDPDAVKSTLARLPRPLFGASAPHLKHTGKNRTVLLYKAYQEVNAGQYFDYPPQAIGDCVSQSFGHGVDLLAAVQIGLGARAERFEQTATEAIYGMARVDIGGLTPKDDDGAVGAWAAQAVSTLGTISRDLVGPYSGQRAKKWGGKGVPHDLAVHAAAHKVHTVSLVKTYDELADAIANGYPVSVCSNQGFTLERDAEGFCAPEDNWAHCMLFVGIRGGARPGACILQSWGNDVPAGPRALDQPPNSFWAEASVVQDMLAFEDSWSISHFDGYPAQVLPARWSYEGFA